MDTDGYARDITKLRLATHAEHAGGKGANLGELVAAGLPVPPAFVLLRRCYLDSMRVSGVDSELNALHREALGVVSDTARLTELCTRMQELVANGGVDDRVRRQTLAA